jgi:hypothetical protein
MSAPARIDRPGAAWGSVGRENNDPSEMCRGNENEG